MLHIILSFTSQHVGIIENAVGKAAAAAAALSRNCSPFIFYAPTSPAQPSPPPASRLFIAPTHVFRPAEEDGLVYVALQQETITRGTC